MFRRQPAPILLALFAAAADAAFARRDTPLPRHYCFSPADAAYAFFAVAPAADD